MKFAEISGVICMVFMDITTLLFRREVCIFPFSTRPLPAVLVYYQLYEFFSFSRFIKTAKKSYLHGFINPYEGTFKNSRKVIKVCFFYFIYFIYILKSMYFFYNVLFSHIMKTVFLHWNKLKFLQILRKGLISWEWYCDSFFIFKIR